jgi:hypothetical protein
MLNNDIEVSHFFNELLLKLRVYWLMFYTHAHALSQTNTGLICMYREIYCDAT